MGGGMGVDGWVFESSRGHRLHPRLGHARDQHWVHFSPMWGELVARGFVAPETGFFWV